MLDYRKGDIDMRENIFGFNGAKKVEFYNRMVANSAKATAKLYKRVLINMIDVVERENKKEWMDFSEDMVDASFFSLNSTSKMGLQSYLSIIKDYLSATTPKDNIRHKGYDYTIQLGADDMEKYINRAGEDMRYLTPNEFEELVVDGIGDPLGKAIMILLYNGVKGEDFNDICNIKVNDIDLDTGIVVYGGNKLLKLNDKYTNIFREAIKSDSYIVYDYNGVSTKISDFAFSKEGYFIRRRVHPKKQGDIIEKPDKGYITRLLGDFMKGIKNSYLTGQSCYNSGTVLRMLEWCNMKVPTTSQWSKYKEKTGATISLNTSQTVAKIFLRKLGEES